MPRLTRESFGGGDQRWLATSHGIANCRTAAMPGDAFRSVAVDGVVPSGYPVAEVNGLLAPYVAGDATAGTLAGHLFTDQKVPATGNVPVPVYDHGRVNTSLVPLEGFTAPAEQPSTTIVYL